MKHTGVEGYIKIKRTPHMRRNMWGVIVRPSSAMKAFKEMRNSGFHHPDYTWQQCCAAYRKKIRKIHIAKESRRRNRR